MVAIVCKNYFLIKNHLDFDIVSSYTTVFVRLGPGGLPIFEVFGGALTRAGAVIKIYENLDLPFPAHTRTLFVIYMIIKGTVTF